jgi:hypothetical protein
MPEAYDDAALRHWTDADVLEKALRFQNADQLYGIASECALKVAISQLPERSSIPNKYRVHVNTLWNLAPLQSLQKRFPGLVAYSRLRTHFRIGI